ncbi:MAG: DUF3429 domain-containing protein [Pontixanthobacter sp.]
MSINETDIKSFRNARLLGYAGLLPQTLAILLVYNGGEWGWIALASGFAYAALVFSFLGGVWWGQAIANPEAPKWVYPVAVMPSLIGLALFIPWTIGWSWPEPSLFWLGLMLMLSPLVDRAHALGSIQWRLLRWHLSIGLGLLTWALALIGQVNQPASM